MKPELIQLVQDTQSFYHSLYLTSVNIDPNHFRNLIKQVLYHPSSSLRTLYFSWNNIGSVGVKHLACALRLNSVIESLYLSSNQIGTEGVRLISLALHDNSTIHTLDLFHNGISFKGAQILAFTLRYYNSSIHFLDLGYNEIGNKGAHFFACALSDNSSICNFSLFKNDIDSKGARKLVSALHRNYSLYALNLDGNYDITFGIKHHSRMQTEKNASFYRLGILFFHYTASKDFLGMVVSLNNDD